MAYEFLSGMEVLYELAARGREKGGGRQIPLPCRQIRLKTGRKPHGPRGPEMRPGPEALDGGDSVERPVSPFRVVEAAEQVAGVSVFFG